MKINEFIDDCALMVSTDADLQIIISKFAETSSLGRQENWTTIFHLCVSFFLSTFKPNFLN